MSLASSQPRACIVAPLRRLLLLGWAATLILVCALAQPAPALAQGSPTSAQTPVPYTISYELSGASEVFLVWGVDGWTIAPPALRPPGTELKSNVMYTPMRQSGSTFSVDLQVPPGTTIDYVFQITQTSDGATDVWDNAGGEGKDYHARVDAGGTTTVQASAAVAYQLAPAERPLPLLLSFAGFAGLGVVASVVATRVRRTGKGMAEEESLASSIRSNALPIMLICIAALYLSAINNGLYLWGDNVHYIVVGKALATGQGFTDIHYPGNPPFTFPIPIFPLLLAPVIFFFDYDLMPLKLLVALFGIGACFLFYRYVRAVLSEGRALLLTMLAAVSPQLISFSHQVMSEIPYLVFSLAALIWLERSARERRRPIQATLVAACIIAVAMLTRSLGVALVGAAVPYLALHAEGPLSARLKRIALVLPTVGVVWLLFNAPILDDIPYIREFLQGTSPSVEASAGSGGNLAERVQTNLKTYLSVVPETVLYSAYRSGSLPLDLLLWAPLVVGFGYCLVARRRAAEFYVLCYVAILLLYEPSDINNTRRYLVPLIPFILYYVAQGLWYGADQLKRLLRLPDMKVPPLAAAASAALAILMLLNLSSSVQASVLSDERGEMFGYRYYEWDSYQNAAAWAKEHTPAESVIMTRMIYYFHYWSHRKVIWYPYEEFGGDTGQMQRAIEDSGADYIAIDALNINQSPAVKKMLEATIADHPSSYELVYEEGPNKLYRLRDDT